MTDINSENENSDEEMPEAQAVHKKVVLQYFVATQNPANDPSSNTKEDSSANVSERSIRPGPSDKIVSPSSTRMEGRPLGAKLNIVSREVVLKTPTNSPFYLCGAYYAPFRPGATKAFLLPNRFSNWIASLNNSYVAMANPWVQSPTSSSAASTPPLPQPVPSVIHPGDKWFQRISNNGLGITQITFAGNIDTASLSQRSLMSMHRCRRCGVARLCSWRGTWWACEAV